ncbi:hypothetical protein Hydth_0545 [Hydrogenobacter thermophilus TK-6]|uniref:Uncharacterized protein n=1 Tax=Hydrogenobacter thermophilus (strain DSM 6534 / IAM 12695 / TK-6) TaxID=608538 RepID=D3DGQ7_HYDTT|nr:hypothetical protein [Hydrogenobacter thermophilus]ADO44945.1 hypothetical protein Hydth_0545 [Hydrogenobacter thermophilus TK-6]BAI69009.1 hypothetical protein HTH_0547 [Hydrogenobacter thermophilus TK-6]
MDEHNQGTPVEQPKAQEEQKPEIALTHEGELSVDLSSWGLSEEEGEQPEKQETQEQAQGEKQEYYTPEEIQKIGIDKLDPNRIPPELLPWYKSMQADYTRKTQALAEERKAIEKLLDKALTDPELAKRFIQDPELVQTAQKHPQLAQKLMAVSQLAQPKKNPFDDIVEQAKRMVEAQFGEPFDEFNPKHTLALTLAGQNILARQAQMLQIYNRIGEIREKEPAFEEIDRLAEQKLYSLPYAEALKIERAIKVGDIDTVLRFWEDVRKEYYQQKLTTKQEPPKVESAGTGEVKTKPSFDPRELAHLSEEEKVRWFIEAGLV